MAVEMRNQPVSWAPKKARELASPQFGEIDCWLLDLDKIPDATTTLSNKELERANRYRFARDRRRFIAGRRAVRAILSAYLDEEPATILFQENDYGKPSVENDGGLAFNFSRSNEYGLLGIAADAVIGIDIEEKKYAKDLVDVAKLNFSKRELSQLQALPEDARLDGFYNCWTRKEAAVKALGEGLSAALKDFEVVLAPGERPAIFSARGEVAEMGNWKIRTFCPAQNYGAAIVTDFTHPQINFFRWIP